MNPEKSFEESVREVMRVLPPPVRTYLSQGKYTLVAKNLAAKYGLRIDQSGVLERELMLLIMGVEEPGAFVASLKSEAGVTEEVSRSILGDVNAQVFVPLREEMMRATTPQPAPQKTVAPMQAPQPASPSPLRDALQKAVPSQVQGSAPRPMPPAPKVPSEVPPTTAPLPPKVALPQARAQAAVVQAGVPRESHVVNLLAKNAPVPQPAPWPPSRPAIVQAPPPRPVAAPAAVTPPVPPPPVPEVPKTPPAPAPKPYAVDPYREAIE